ncbi:hypothetical protein R3P38DRAFT_3191114 [Favolaschia claudopus]|uniref:Uncharacterized protein n=1 Tax=Favolaschia claudopus TaxID=2862362 RepID=A0AAW0BLI8_9AGAR
MYKKERCWGGGRGHGAGVAFSVAFLGWGGTKASGEGARPLKKRAQPGHQLRFHPVQRPVLSRTQEASYPASNSLPHNPAAISIPTQVMASPIPTPRPSSTSCAPSVAMPTAVPSPSPRCSSSFAYGH